MILIFAAWRLYWIIRDMVRQWVTLRKQNLRMLKDELDPFLYCGEIPTYKLKSVLRPEFISFSGSCRKDSLV